MLPRLTSLAILLFASSTSLFSQIAIDENSFLRLQNYTTGANSVHLASGDLDGDGKPDLAVANFGSNTISVFLNTSGQSINLSSKIDLLSTEKPTSVTIADINNDGKPEIIASLQSSYVAVYKNISSIGQLAFDAHILTPTNQFATSIASADIDGDNYVDVAVVNNQSNSVTIYSNANKSGGIDLFESAKINTLGSVKDLTFARINDDDKPELIITSYYSQSLSIFTNESSSGLISMGEPVHFDADPQANTVKAGDINGDNKPDLVIGNANIFTLSVLVNTGQGANITFAPAQTFQADQTQYGVALTDLDKDGKTDIATGNFSVNTMSVLMNNSKPEDDTVAFASTYTYQNINSAPYDILAVDLNKDGYDDLVTASFNTEGYITVWFNNLAQAQPPVHKVSGFSPVSSAIGATITIYGTNFSTNAQENKVYFGSIEADVVSATSDALNVVVPPGATFNVISVVINGFVASSPYSFNVTFPGGGGGVVYNVDFFADQGNLPAGNPRTIKFADFDGDGKPDIVFSQQSANKLSLYRNISSTNTILFADLLDLPTGNDPFDITVNDFSGDGKPDIAVTNMNAGNASTVMVFKNNSSSGDLSFQNVATLDAGSGATGIVSSDFNFDGKIDIAIAAGNAGYFYYLKNTGNNGNISFAPIEEPRNWNHSSTMLQADIDGDAIPDVITTNFSAASITVNINDGLKELPTFSGSKDFAAGQYPSDLAIGDIDGDGKQDVLVNNYGSSDVTVLRNISVPGAPDFESSTITSGKDPMSITLADFDGDGKIEMIVASSEPGKIGIYKNLSSPGNIAFGEVAYYETGNGPTEVACADLDGDGKTDMAIANGYNAVSIVRNTYGEPLLTPSGSNPVYGAVTQEVIFDSTVNTHRGQPYVQRHYDITPVNNANTATGTITLYFKQSDFDAFNAHPVTENNLPKNAQDVTGIANLRVYQYHGTSTEGLPGTYSGSTVVIDPDDSRIIWNAETEWWEVSFEVDGFSGFFVSVPGDGMTIPEPGVTNTMSIYPNPVYSGVATVKHPPAKNAQIKIVDIQGKIVRILRTENDASQSEVNMCGLATGIYTIMWQTANATKVVKVWVP